MRASPAFEQVAPDRLEIRSGGGCQSIFGIPFFAAGIFMLLVAVQIVPMSNASEVPFWAWPVIFLMGLIFAGAGSALSFGRTRTVVDRGRGRVTKEWRLFVPVRREEQSLLDYRAVVLSFSPGDSDSADRYDVALERDARRSQFGMYSGTEYGRAAAQAAELARFLRLPFVDKTTDHAVVSEPRGAELGLAQRLENGAPLDKIVPPPTLRSRVVSEGKSVRITIPAPRPTGAALAGYAVPVVILLVVGTRTLDFYAHTRTPLGVQIGFSALLVLFLGVLPLASLFSALLKARRGATVVTASPLGIDIAERGAWKTTTKRIPAAGILDVDYSTRASSYRSIRHAAERRMGRSAPAWVPGEALDREDLSPVRRTLPRWTRSKGVVVKAKEGFFYFGAGLPDEEIEYLWAVAVSALAGSFSA